MTSAVRNTRQPGRLAFRWIVGLLLIVGLGAAALILVLVYDEGQSQAQSSLAPAPADVTPTSEPTDQPILADDSEPRVNDGVETPEATPASTPTTPVPTSEPTPENDTAAFAESADANPTQEPESTVAPESGSSSSSDETSTDTSDGNSSSNTVQGSSNPAATSPTAPQTGSSRKSIQKIEIPAIGVNAPIEVKSIDAAGVMQNPSSAHAVAWYDFTSRPEDRGNAVFAGHLDYAGVGPAVFWELGSLTSGDEVRVTLGDGSVVRYRVTGVRSVPADADASDIVASGNVAKITIITCEGSFDPASQNYNKRTIVTGERVS